MIDAEQCVHCHICQEHCSFLGKYKIDIGDTQELEKLAYHCFLCGKCTQVCPVGIDGREIVLNIRRAQVAQDQGEHVGRSYKRTIAEKQEYSYRNYRHVTAKSVLFPGCNFPSVYPKTTKKLAELMENRFGIGIVYDCCGKPIADLGMAEQEKRILEDLDERLRREG
jgi:Fe-S oxidoreductase